MYYVYVLKSTARNFYYTGCTNNLKQRFKEHIYGNVRSTKAYLPLELIYYEACLSEKDAYLREKYLKSRLGKNYLRKRIKNWLNQKLLRYIDTGRDSQGGHGASLKNLRYRFDSCSRHLKFLQKFKV